MRVLVLVIASVFLSSCFLLRDHKRQSFSYTDASGTTATVAAIVPKGFKRQETIKDSLGYQGVAYHYLGGAQFYILYAPQGGNYQIIDTSVHISQPHLQGGIFYKGIDSTKRWWREAQPPSFRIGYLNVSNDSEIAFDSAVNFLKPDVFSYGRKR